MKIKQFIKGSIKSTIFAILIATISLSYAKGFEKTFGGKYEDVASAITKTIDGGFIVAGGTKSFGNGDKDVYLIKIDKSGNRVWQKTFGGSYWDKAKAITPTDDGGFIVAGWTTSFGNGSADAYLIKIDKDGNTK